MNLPVDTLLHGGTYKIIRFINSGGFGCTYEAEHIMLAKRVAIKEFFVKDFCNRNETTFEISIGTLSKKTVVEKLRKKFVEEARLLFEMQHPGIVRVTDIFEENGTAYYVMDYIEGTSLDKEVKQRGALPESEALNYIRQVCDALRYVHGHNRLHLDIKPGNIMLNKAGKAILIDFGASKHYDEESGENTSTLMGINTPGYAPIEQISGTFSTFSPTADIYAIGATLYKLLTGITPPPVNQLAGGEKVLAPLPEKISLPVRQAVAQALELNKNHRPQSVDEFLKILEGKKVAGVPEAKIALMNSDDRTLFNEKKKTSSSPTTPATPPQKGNGKWIALIAIIVLLLVGLGYLFIQQRGEQTLAKEREELEQDKEKFEKRQKSQRRVEEQKRLAREEQEHKKEEEERILAESLKPIHEEHDWVDLGLSVKWATCNVGADNPWETGDYYEWGETQIYDNYSTTDGMELKEISGNSNYDAARKHWKGTWRLPTKAEFQELIDSCTWSCDSQNNGYKITGPSGESIFLPAAGWWEKDSLSGIDLYGGYWSSTPSGKANAYYLYFSPKGKDIGCYNRYRGRTLRPVVDL